MVRGSFSGVIFITSVIVNLIHSCILSYNLNKNDRLIPRTSGVSHFRTLLRVTARVWERARGETVR